MNAVATAPCIVVLLGLACGGEGSGNRGAEDPARDAVLDSILSAEDARAPTEEALATLTAGASSHDPEVRRPAVRALGRLERPSTVAVLVPLLEDPDPSVRGEVAGALGRAARGGDPAAARRALLGRLPGEGDPLVRGAILTTLGRLSASDGASADTLAGLLASHAAPSDGGASGGGPVSEHPPAATVLGAARGLEALLRRPPPAWTPGEGVVTALGGLVAYTAPEAEPLEGVPDPPALVRELALTALGHASAATPAVVDGALSDPDVQVRRVATGLAARSSDPSRALGRALDDPSGLVRYEALRAYGRLLQSRDGCPAVVAALDDPSPHVALLAVDLLGQGCPDDDPEPLLQEMVAGLEPDSRHWHRPAHALVSLARLRPGAPGAHLGRFARHGVWQVRAYAARAADLAGAEGVLRALAADPHPNVREAAIRGLVERSGREADPLYRAALESDDPQLLITASAALEGTTEGERAFAALLGALRRTTEQRKETSRDARVALLERMAEVGGEGRSAELAPWLSDFDSVVAGAAARIVARWTGDPAVATPRPLPSPPVPDRDELRRLDRSRVVLRMRGAGEIEIRLLPFEAPTNAARFARLAGSGYFDGLTFHRVVPNFVIQGGSPGANEYVGDGPYTRDELTSRPHLRGTVGLSTRGRDTGDGQIFVNLVDNVRLDGDYTIFGIVVRGMDVVDGVLEGAVIESASVVEPPVTDGR